MKKSDAVLTNAKWLPLPLIYLACALLDNELTDYKCYNTAQSNPAHWIYWRQLMQIPELNDFYLVGGYRSCVALWA